jgi:hypothetical protein
MSALVIDLALEPRSKTTHGLRSCQEPIATVLRARCLTVDRDNRFGVDCEFWASTRQRCDVDNMAKVILDAATGIVWEDDSQVLELHARLHRSAKAARIKVTIFQVENDEPLRACQHCGKRYRAFPSEIRRNKAFCSVNCHAESAWRSASCRQCSQPYRLRRCHAERGKRPFCSRRCASIFWGRTRRTQYRCRHCAGPVSRREYKRCMACRLIGKAA